ARDPLRGACGRELRGRKLRPPESRSLGLSGNSLRDLAAREVTLADLDVLVVDGNGMHKYNNQDHSMMTALLVARRIATGSLLDPWKVNADAVYQDRKSVV